MAKLWLANPDLTVPAAVLEYPPAGGLFDVKAALTAGGGAFTPSSEGLRDQLLALATDAAGTRLLETMPSTYEAFIAAEPGLIGYWPLDEAAGSYRDSSGAGNPGTYSTGTRGQTSILPNGEGGSIGGTPSVAVTTASVFDFQANAPFTAEAWVKNNIAGGTRYIIGKINTGNLGGWGLRKSGADALVFLALNAAGTVTGTIGAPAPLLSVGALRHIAVSYDGSRARLYVDSNLITTSAVFSSNIPAVTQALSIGTSPPGSSGWNGWLQHVAVYNRALSAGEIAQHYLRGTLAA